MKISISAIIFVVACASINAFAQNAVARLGQPNGKVARPGRFKGVEERLELLDGVGRAVAFDGGRGLHGHDERLLSRGKDR